jgi:hypothetical protein
MVRNAHKVWLTSLEFREVKLKAEKLGKSVSGFLREAALRMAKENE